MYLTARDGRNPNDDGISRTKTFVQWHFMEFILVDGNFFGIERLSMLFLGFSPYMSVGKGRRLKRMSNV